ncbi:MAG: hypothetical protein SGJ10_09160 [Bacteroidota bacterium]|nr:hypothetical protein [Bacteroidota bacterium]
MAIIKHIDLKLLILISSLLLLEYSCSSIKSIKQDSKYAEAYLKINNVTLNKSNSWVIINKPGSCGDWICGARLHNFILSNLTKPVSNVYLIIGNHYDGKLDSIVSSIKNITTVYDVNNNLARYGFNKIETRVLHYKNNKCILSTNLNNDNYLEIGKKIKGDN